MRKIPAILAIVLALTAPAIQAQIIPIPFAGINDLSINWWTTVLTNAPGIFPWQAWQAVNTNFATVQAEIVAADAFSAGVSNNLVTVSNTAAAAAPLTYATGVSNNVVAATNNLNAAIVARGYLTGNQSITISKDGTGTGTTAISLTVTNIEPPGSSSTGQPLVKTSTGVGFGTISGSMVTGLLDTQTNAMLNSFQAAAIVSNLVSIAAGATNVLGWVTNLAMVTYSVPPGTYTNYGFYGSNAPVLLYSYDGTNYAPGVASLVTNVAVSVAFCGGSVPSNPPTQQIPLAASVTNVTVWKMTRPDLFGVTNALFGESLLIQDPTQPLQVANKEYVDASIQNTAWWNAQQPVELNGYNLNLSPTWLISTDSLTNNTSYHLSFLGTDAITATATQPISISAFSVTVTNSTNVLVKVPTNGLASTPVLELSHYIVPPIWTFLTNTPTITGTNYVWLFKQPYTDSGFLLAATLSTNPVVVTLSSMLRLPPLTLATSSNGTFGFGAGMVCVDSNYVYVSVATNLWRRAALSSW